MLQFAFSRILENLSHTVRCFLCGWRLDLKGDVAYWCTHLNKFGCAKCKPNSLCKNIGCQTVVVKIPENLGIIEESALKEYYKDAIALMGNDSRSCRMYGYTI